MADQPWIDADAHVHEPPAVWDRLDKEFRDRVQITRVTEEPGWRDVIYDVSLDGMPIPYTLGSRAARFEKMLHERKEKFSPYAGIDPGQTSRISTSKGSRSR